jgi:hypothetical protein
MDENETDDRNDVLENLFNRAKPKSRYISESHIEEETNSITKEIINGDIEVSRNKTNVTPTPLSSTTTKKRTTTKTCCDAGSSNRSRRKRKHSNIN